MSIPCVVLVRHVVVYIDRCLVFPVRVCVYISMPNIVWSPRMFAQFSVGVYFIVLAFSVFICCYFRCFLCIPVVFVVTCVVVCCVLFSVRVNISISICRVCAVMCAFCLLCGVRVLLV